MPSIWDEPEYDESDEPEYEENDCWGFELGDAVILVSQTDEESTRMAIGSSGIVTELDHGSNYICVDWEDGPDYWWVHHKDILHSVDLIPAAPIIGTYTPQQCKVILKIRMMDKRFNLQRDLKCAA